MATNLMIVIFRNQYFNLTLIIYIVGQAMDLIIYYYQNQLYKNSHPSDWASVIDLRTIVIHVVIVLGTFAFNYAKVQFPNHHQLPTLIFICLFVFLKSIADYIYISKQNKWQ